MKTNTRKHAAITFWRFRQLSRDTMSALSTTNSRATSRTRRAKRRLYFMTLSILVPYLPLMLLYFVNNVRYLLPLDPYDFSAIHGGDVTGQPWNSIVLLPSKAIDWASMNDRFSAMLTAIPVFGFFGMSKEALNMYRVYLVALGFGRIWPVLNEEYDPDGRSHYGSSQGILTSSETTQYVPPLPIRLPQSVGTDTDGVRVQILHETQPLRNPHPPPRTPPSNPLPHPFPLLGNPPPIPPGDARRLPKIPLLPRPLLRPGQGLRRRRHAVAGVHPRAGGARDEAHSFRGAGCALRS